MQTIHVDHESNPDQIPNVSQHFESGDNHRHIENVEFDHDTTTNTCQPQTNEHEDQIQHIIEDSTDSNISITHSTNENSSQSHPKFHLSDSQIVELTEHSAHNTTQTEHLTTDERSESNNANDDQVRSNTV